MDSGVATYRDELQELWHDVDAMRQSKVSRMAEVLEVYCKRQFDSNRAIQVDSNRAIQEARLAYARRGPIVGCGGGSPYR